MTKKKRFIDKKKSVTYRLVPTERGPDDEAPKNVWVEVSNKEKKPVPCMFEQPAPVQTERVFPSKGPRPDWDPDVIAALDDDFDFEDPENTLEDDFVTQANDGVQIPPQKQIKKTKVDLFGDVCSESDYSDSDGEVELDNKSDDFSQQRRYRQSQFSSGRSKMTSHYSMTSAVTNCSEAQKFQNEKFEKILEQYDDDQIGGLDFEDVEGPLSLDSLRIQELLESTQKEEECLQLGTNDLKDKILNYASIEKPETYEEIVVEKPIEFDCESILTTYSTVYNHPTVIKSDSKISAKILRQRLTKSRLKQLEKEQSDGDKWETHSTATVCSSARPKDETSEERRLRKKMVKDVRRENRAIKKENKVAFGQEKQKQLAQEINTRLTSGIKIM